MEFMLDSGNLKEIEALKKLDLLERLTTNPIIIQRGIAEMGYSGDFIDYAKRILEFTGDKPAFFQVASHSKEDILKDARRIYRELKKYGNVFVKVPIDTSKIEGEVNYSGLTAIQELEQEGIPTLATAIVTPVQAFLAARLGAKYVVLMLRPYDNIIAEKLSLGDLSETGYLNNRIVLQEMEKKDKSLDTYLSGLDVLDRTSRVFKTHRLNSKLIIAGIRNPVQLSDVLEREGPSAVTLPYKVFTSLLGHEATKRFVRDTYNAAGENSIYGRFLRNGAK